MILFLFILLTVTIFMIYLFLSWNFTHWSNRGIKGPRPLPLFGSFPGLVTNKQHFADDINDIYRQESLNYKLQVYKIILMYIKFKVS